MSDQASLRYAVIFRTHFWDAFAQRQFDRLRSRVSRGDIYVVVDETSHPVPNIPHDRILPVTEAGLLAMGFAAAGEGNLLWYNGDYPLYRFVEEHGDYEYYLQLEYDVVFNTDIDALVARAAADHVDFVGLTKGEPTPEWYWRDSCAEVYELDQVEHQLICVSLFSNRALRYLWQRRLELSEAYRRGEIASWPMCEGFIPTELALGGYKSAELSDYGSTATYDHWPPYLEADLHEWDDQPFVHPVLDQPRYIGSLFKYKIGLSGYLQPNSLFHQKLRRLPPAVYVGVLARSFAEKTVRTLRGARGSA